MNKECETAHPSLPPAARRRIPKLIPLVLGIIGVLLAFPCAIAISHLSPALTTVSIAGDQTRNGTIPYRTATAGTGVVWIQSPTLTSSQMLEIAKKLQVSAPEDGTQSPLKGPIRPNPAGSVDLGHFNVNSPGPLPIEWSLPSDAPSLQFDLCVSTFAENVGRATFRMAALVLRILGVLSIIASIVLLLVRRRQLKKPI